MTTQHRNFLLIVTLLLAIEAGFLWFMVKFTPVASNTKFLVVILLVFLVLIPFNIFAAWKITGNK